MSPVTFDCENSNQVVAIWQQSLDWSCDKSPTVRVDSREQPRRENIVKRDCCGFV